MRDLLENGESGFLTTVEARKRNTKRDEVFFFSFAAVHIFRQNLR
jgi:hypothetical protein